MLRKVGAATMQRVGESLSVVVGCSFDRCSVWGRGRDIVPINGTEGGYGSTPIVVGVGGIVELSGITRRMMSEGVLSWWGWGGCGYC